jgi:hypothetical protein
MLCRKYCRGKCRSLPFALFDLRWNGWLGTISKATLLRFASLCTLLAREGHTKLINRKLILTEHYSAYKRPSAISCNRVNWARERMSPVRSTLHFVI